MTTETDTVIVQFRLSRAELDTFTRHTALLAIAKNRRPSNAERLRDFVIKDNKRRTAAESKKAGQ